MDEAAKGLPILRRRWGAIEVKMGAGEIPRAEESLSKLRDLVVGGGGSPPSFMMILMATGYASVTEKGALAVPIGCLGPSEALLRR